MDIAKEAMKKQFDKKRRKPQKIKGWRQYVAKSQKYPFEVTFKNIGPKEIQIF